MSDSNETTPAAPDASIADGNACDWRPRAEIAHNMAQAKALKDKARAGGLRFEVQLAPSQALWLLGLIESGKFADPGEALFVMLGEQQDLEPHADLRKEILKRSLDAALNDPGPMIPLEDVFCDIRKKMEGPQPEPAVWQSWPGAGDAGKDTDKDALVPG